MIDLALIVSPSPAPLSALAAQFSSTPPLGLVYMAAVLRGSGYRVQLVDMNLPSRTLSYLRRFLAIKRPRMVGISTLTESYPNAARIACLVKNISPQVAVVVGGPHVTFTPQETLADDHFDFVVCGEGEETLAELADCLLRQKGSLEEIHGLCRRRGKEVHINPRRAQLEKLDELPLPARELLPLERYANAGALITGRGCPGRCIFCSAGAMFGGRYRRRNSGDVVSEMKMLSHMGVRSLLFLDDSLTADLERLDRMLYMMKSEGIHLPWVCESRVDIEDPAFFETMARAGCTGVQLGIESGSEHVLSRLGKGTCLSQVVRAVEGANRAGISPMCSMMIGLPEDTVETAMETIRLAERLQREYYVQIGVSIATPFPGTHMYRNARKLGLTIRETDYGQYNLHTPVMETKHLALEEIRNLHFESVDRLRKSARPGMWSLFPPPPALSGVGPYDYRRHLY